MLVSRIFRSRQKSITSFSLAVGQDSVLGISGLPAQPASVTPHCLPIEAGANAPARAVASALRAMFDTDGAPTIANLVLSSHYCRYLSLPWSDVLLDATSGADYLRRAFADAYGDGAADWEIVIPDMSYGQTVVACAVDHAVLDQVRDASLASRLTHVRPYFSAAYESFRKQIDAANAVFAVVEEGLMTVGRICERSVVEVDVLPAGDAWPKILVAWLSRTSLLEGEPGPVFVACPPAWRGSAPQETGADWRFLEWPEPVRELVAANPALSLAACLQ